MRRAAPAPPAPLPPAAGPAGRATSIRFRRNGAGASPDGDRATGAAAARARASPCSCSPSTGRYCCLGVVARSHRLALDPSGPVQESSRASGQNSMSLEAAAPPPGPLQVGQGGGWPPRRPACLAAAPGPLGTAGRRSPGGLFARAPSQGIGPACSELGPARSESPLQAPARCSSSGRLPPMPLTSLGGLRRPPPGRKAPPRSRARTAAVRSPGRWPAQRPARRATWAGRRRARSRAAVSGKLFALLVAPWPAYHQAMAQDPLEAGPAPARGSHHAVLR